MTEINIQDDLNAVNDQITKMVEELNRISTARDQMIQQIQNMNGVAMYLRGKLPPAQPEVPSILGETEREEDFERDLEYPPDNA